MSLVRVEIEASDFGALPVLVAREITAVERWVKAHPVLSSEADVMTYAYLTQLRVIEEALLAARGRPA